MILASGSDYDDLYPSRNHARGKYEIKDGDFIYLSQREDAAPTDPSGAAFMYNRKRKVSDYYNQTCSRYQGWSHENIWTGGPCKIQGNRWMYNYFSFDLDGDGNPPLRDDAGGVYAEHFNGGESALFGGEYACGNNTCYLADFWLYSSSSWFKPTVNLEPPGRSEMGLSYDTARQCIVLFGGKGTDLFDDTWELSAGGSPGSYIWTVISPDDPEGDGNPAAREGHVLVYDPDEQVTVLFGGRLADGSYSAETWLWDGTSWALVEQFDPEGDGNPDARADLAVAWHDSRGSLIIHGGLGEDGATDDVWEWTGVSWRVLSLVDAEGDGGPGARYDHAMVYDAHHDHLTLVGGEGASYERWIGRLGNTGRPAHIARFDTSVMDNCEAPDFTEVRILWRGGGTGFPDEPDYHGTTLMNWEKGEWQDVSDNSAGADAPEDLTWSTNDPDRIYRMLFGSHEELCFASAPVHPNGSGRTIVATDYLQLVVSYRMAEDAPDSCD
jgi:hypothetical protein